MLYLRAAGYEDIEKAVSCTLVYAAFVQQAEIFVGDTNVRGSDVACGIENDLRQRYALSAVYVFLFIPIRQNYP
ncbi:MAG TPA: hypothetical protein DCZ71_07555 [Ruminococcus sp.]|nr:hypothetical protein [Ruminococcus sp.]